MHTCSLPTHRISELLYETNFRFIFNPYLLSAYYTLFGPWILKLYWSNYLMSHLTTLVLCKQKPCINPIIQIDIFHIFALILMCGPLFCFNEICTWILQYDAMRLKQFESWYFFSVFFNSYLKPKTHFHICYCDVKVHIFL